MDVDVIDFETALCVCWVKGYFMAKNSFVAEVTFKECKCEQIRNFLFPDLFTFTKEIFNGKLYFLCSAACRNMQVLPYIPVCTSLVKVTNQMKSCFYMQVTGKSYCSLQKSSIKKIAISSVFSEAATEGVFIKNSVLKNLANSQENTCARVSFLIKLQYAIVVIYVLYYLQY